MFNIVSATYGAAYKLNSNTLVYHGPSSGLLLVMQVTKKSVISYILPCPAKISAIEWTLMFGFPLQAFLAIDKALAGSEATVDLIMLT